MMPETILHPAGAGKIMWRIFVIIGVFFIAACTGMASQQRISDLDESLDRYVAALRWAYYTDALSYHLTRKGKQAEVDEERLDNFSVTGLEIKEKILSEDENEALVKGELVYYHKEYGTVRKLKLNQIWWYSEETKHWFIESAFPDLK
jgi:hypothetical protein